MKTKRLAIISLVTFVAIVLGAAAIVSQSAAVIGANVSFDPKTWTLDTPPNPWNAEISLKGGHKAQVEIDPSTILLEGLYSPSGATYNATHGPRLIVPFLGTEVEAAITAKLPTHNGILIPGTYRVSLIVSGTLLPAYGSLPWSGDGVITVTVPPPPPP